MNTIMIGFRCFSKSLRPCALDEISLSIGRVNWLKKSNLFLISKEQHFVLIATSVQQYKKYILFF